MDAQYIPSLEELERMEHRRDFALFGISLLILGFAIASFPLFVLPNVRGLLPPNEPMRMPEALFNGLAALLEVGVLLCGYGIVVIGIGYLALRSLERVCDGFGSGTIRREQLKERREILLRVHSIYSRAIESGEVTLKDWCFLFPGDPAADNAWSRRSPEWGRVGACKECGHTKFWVVHTSNSARVKHFETPCIRI